MKSQTSISTAQNTPKRGAEVEKKKKKHVDSSVAPLGPRAALSFFKRRLMHKTIVLVLLA